MSSDTASASLSAVASARGLRSDGSLTALTVSATQCANSAMRLSWSKFDDKRPQVGHVARHLRRPTGVAIRPCLARLCILDTIRMRGQYRADRTDIENVGVRAAIEDLRGERMGDGHDGDVRLLAQGEAKPEGTVRGEVADQDVRQRLVTVASLPRPRPIRNPHPRLHRSDDPAVLMDGATALDLRRSRPALPAPASRPRPG